MASKVRIKKKDLVDVANKLRDTQEPTDNSSVLVSDKYLKDIANAIRMVDGISDKMKPSVFASKLGNHLYTVTFDGNGGTGGYYHKQSGDTLGTLPESEKTGYGFYGWYDGTTQVTKDTVVTADVTYTAKWGNVLYKIKYINNNSEAELSDNPTKYSVDTETFTLTIPTCSKNYLFAGWTGSNGTTPSRTVTISKGSTGDKEYTANFTTNDASKCLSIQYCLCGAKLADKHGKNWSVDDDGNLLYKGSKTEHLIKSDRTDINTHPEWKTNWLSGDWVAPIKFDDENELNLIYEGATPENTWFDVNSKQSDTADYYYRFYESPTCLIPHWYFASNPKYTITYNLNGGTAIGSNITDYYQYLRLYYTGVNINDVQAYFGTLHGDIIKYKIKKDGYIFAGLKDSSDNKSYSCPVYIPSNTTGNKTYTAIWITKDQIPDPVIINNKKASEITWANGTIDELQAMVKAADEGKIDLSYYWNVGDTRTVSISDIEAMSPLTDTHGKQDLNWVLLSSGGKVLKNSVKDVYGNERKTCSFVVGVVDGLSEKGELNSTQTNIGGWDRCDRRTWCNSSFKNSLPSDFLSLFKQFYTFQTMGTYSRTTLVASVDYFSLLSQGEIISGGGNANTSMIAEEYINYYNDDTTKRNKSSEWWTNSPHYYDSENFVKVNTSGGVNYENPTTKLLLCPIGCI